MRQLIVVALACAAMACGSAEPPPAPLKPIDPSAAGLGPKPAPESVSAMFERATGQPAPASGSHASELVNRPGQSDEELQAKTREEHAQTLQLLPARSEQVNHIRIGWYVNQSVDAFREAIETRKALVLFVGTNWCHWCAKQIANVVRCAAVERFAGDGVFAYGFVGEDKGTDAIAGSLKFGGYPVITVLEPDDEMILERGRINGYFKAPESGQHLEGLLYTASPRTREPRLAPAPLPSRPATAIDALLGATNAKLTHRAPQPDCSK